MKKITIGYDAVADAITVDPDPLKCSVNNDRKVQWVSDLEDWRVVFGPNAPVVPKVAARGSASDQVTLKGNRSEDYRRVKYVVVAWTGTSLSHLDPELIVDP